MPPTMPPGFVDMMTNARSGDDDRDHHRQRHHVAEKNQAEDRDLDRLGLDIGDGDDERALAHRREHQRGRRDLRRGAVAAPRARTPMPVCGSGAPVHSITTGEKDERKRKAEQEPHMGGAERAERAGQLALHRIAHGLRGRGDDREDDPEPGIARSPQRHAALSATTM